MSKSAKEPIRYVLTEKYRKTKNWQLPLKNFMHPDAQGHIRRVIYIPDADTIFANEYKGDRNPESVWFSEGNLFVKPTDVNLLKILDIHPYKNKFYKLHDERVEAQVRLNKNELVKKALKLIDMADTEKLKATAFAVLEGYSFEMDDKVMQAELEDKAFESPQWLIDTLTDPNFHTKQIAALSVLKGILKINPERTAITWKDGKILVAVPPGQDAIRRLGEFLAENTMESKRTLQELGEANKLQRRSSGPKFEEMIDAEVEKKSEEQAPSETSSYDGMSNEDLHMAYESLYGKGVANLYKNNREWIIKKLQEAPVES